MALKGKAHSFSTYNVRENFDIRGVHPFTTSKQDDKVDFDLPEGMGGRSRFFVINNPHSGLECHKLQAFYTYKQDDKINIWEGVDRAEITARVDDALVTHHPHSGLDIRALSPYLTERWEDKIDTFKIPYGMGGRVRPFITMKVLALVGYLNDLSLEKVGGIAIENNYFSLKSIQSIKDIPVDNNNTADDGTTTSDAEEEG